MRTNFLPGLILLIAVVIVSGCVKQSLTEVQQNATAPEPGFSTYNDTIFRLSVEYPSNWTVQQRFGGTIVSFTSPQEDASDIFLENINIVNPRLPSENVTLQMYITTTTAERRAEITDFRLLVSENATLGNMTAQKVIYTGIEQGYNLTWMQVFALKDEKVYVFTYTGEANKFEALSPTLDRMLRSFRLF